MGNSLTITVGERVKEFNRSGSERSSSNLTKSLSPSSRKSLYGSKTTMSGAEAVSVATSDDSGIVLGNMNSNNRPNSRSDSRPGSGSRHATDSEPSPPGTLSKNNVLTTQQQNNGFNNGLGKIEEVSVASSASRCSSAVQQEVSVSMMPLQASSHTHNGSSHAAANRSLPLPSNMTPLNLLRKKSLESKAWYEVPSDDEREAVDEADSLASIISTRGGSSDED